MYDMESGNVNDIEKTKQEEEEEKMIKKNLKDNSLVRGVKESKILKSACKILNILSKNKKFQDVVKNKIGDLLKINITYKNMIHKLQNGGEKSFNRTRKNKNMRNI